MKSFKNVYFIGGGIASLSGACFLVRDLGFDGKNIRILEELPVLGGSNDASGNAETGYLMRGGRMWNRSTYENTWELFDSIPSIYEEGKTLKQEIFDFDDKNPTHSTSRLVDKNGKKVLDNYLFKLDKNDKKKMTKLIMTRSEKPFEDVKINQYFDEHFFTSNFWLMFSTTFAFNPWHSVLELRRYVRRFLHEIDGLYDLSAVARTPYNQYESITLPMKAYLEKFGVAFNTNCIVKDINFTDGNNITVCSLDVIEDKKEKTIEINTDDAVIFTNGCMTDTYSWGDWNTAPQIKDKGNCFTLWDKIASKKQNLGNPIKFDGNVKESAWGSFTITFKNSLFFDTMEKFTGNRCGTGGLVTCKDSNWLLSMVLAYQPHYKQQPDGTYVGFGVIYRPFAKGNFIKKPFYECTGKEVFEEWLNFLKLENRQELIDSVVDCKPLFTPMGIAQFMARNGKDRPKVIPEKSTNFACIGQFCEIENDIVFTEEYSVRSAKMAVYGLFKHKGKIKKVRNNMTKPCVLLNAFKVMNRKK